MFGSLENRAKWACLYAGAVWGLFWIPLRALADQGVSPLWITVIYFLVPTLIVFPLFAIRLRSILAAGWGFQLTVLASGAALTMYSASIVFTDVIRALMLFYLMPIWSAILARIILGEAITPIRVLAMVLAALGMLTLFGLGAGLPIPKNIGDWMGLIAGLFWAITMVRIRQSPDYHAADLTVGFFVWGLFLTVFMALLIAPGDMPSLETARPALPLMLLFAVFLIIPGTYASLWGPKYLNPATGGLLFMTEIVVGAISAAILTGEPFGMRELIGVLLITCASLIEPLRELFGKKKARA